MTSPGSGQVPLDPVQYPDSTAGAIQDQPVERSPAGPPSALGIPEVGPPSSWDRVGPGLAGSGLALVVLLGILWGSAYPVIRAGIVAGAPPLLFASIRYLLTAAALVPIALIGRSPRPAGSDLVAPAVFGGLFIVGIYGALLYLGEETTPGGVAAVLTASAPLATAVFGYWLLPTERFGRWGSIGLVVGFGGVCVLVLPQLLTSGSLGFDGPVLVVGAMLAFAIGSVLLRRTARAQPGLWTLVVQFTVAGALIGAMALLFHEPLALGHAATVVPSLAFLIVFPGILGYTLYFRIHHTSGPTRANVVGYVAPVTGVLVGFLVFGEPVTPIEILGMVLIAAGLFLLRSGSAHRTDRLSGGTGPRPRGSLSPPDDQRE
jgi:probable blue pigment (indigoidine) exporter